MTRQTKTLTVRRLKEVLDDLSGDLPIVIAGGTLRVASAEVIYQAVDVEIVYQASFSSFDYCGLDGDDKPTAVVLRVVAV